MTIRVLFFGVLKDVVGAASASVELPEGATAEAVLAEYRRSHPAIEKWIPSLAVSVNQEYSPLNTKLRAGDEVGLLPPVSGGSAPEGSAPRCAIIRERIDTAKLLEGAKRGEDGAAIVFEGIVRNNTRGRRTLYLDYEAYETMALAKLEELASGALEKFAVRDARIVHRIGRLEIGEASVVICVTSAHRSAAFEACRWIIDTLKKTVPIWKKEYFEDGAVWADGEAFPADVSAGGAKEKK